MKLKSASVILQANTMVMEWKEFLWDVPEERSAIWYHCQELFIKHSFPALQVLAKNL